MAPPPSISIADSAAPHSDGVTWRWVRRVGFGVAATLFVMFIVSGMTGAWRSDGRWFSVNAFIVDVDGSLVVLMPRDPAAGGREAIGQVWFWDDMEYSGRLPFAMAETQHRGFRATLVDQESLRRGGNVTSTLLARDDPRLPDLRDSLRRAMLGGGKPEEQAAAALLPDHPRETRPLFIGIVLNIALWIACAALSGAGLESLYTVMRDRISRTRVERALGRQRCPKCGYSTIGLTEPRCPECGLSWADAERG